MVDITVIKKYLKGNFTGMGLKIDLGKDLIIPTATLIKEDFLCLLSTVITSLYTWHLILVDESHTYPGK